MRRQIYYNVFRTNCIIEIAFTILAMNECFIRLPAAAAVWIILCPKQVHFISF